MHLDKLSLINYKNYKELSIQLSPQVNCFVGKNGMGKTNVLDAIYYLSNCKSFFNPIDSQNINDGEDFFVLEGEFIRDEEKEKIYCGVKRGRKKVFKKGKVDYERLSEHIGYINTVMISPIDGNLILDGSDTRRKYIDHIISQYNPEYLKDLIHYNKVLAQRNALLKQFQEARQFDATSLEVWDDQLIEYGEKVFNTRREFIDLFIPIFNKHYKKISKGKEEVYLAYRSHLLDGDFKELLTINNTKDRYSAYTNIGIHKDDYVFKLGEKSLKKFGSQGQQKTYLIALKLAHYKFIEEKSYHKPILLLDDIYDKLDEERIAELMSAITKDNFGQVFITDTDESRLSEFFKKKKYHCKTFIVKNGAIK